ncbi:cbb3-type cytochrome oxidase assembly protein CcoS [Amaricoccus solimangrovi]|uniref:Cbb3-type cytochrome oxidase assembly protein CcoS n=1 Tax=Amaricoccus solimangrovi TaxID=2589815 RepID=A0A501WMP0_9RHOB|nr:cbb3-type cytochrome oxidase assembly protein CcoS [Amaricoccus solimangrovi]TPE50709.1 cbb3-type cytochrome oxidase assembly protein CcoS [Amaricoccus solimangrovi]
MTILALLIPASLALGGLALLAFVWMLRHDQFEDPQGEAMRILDDRHDREPAADPRSRRSPD